MSKLEKYALYLDDERTPKTNRKFIIVRSCDEAIELVKENGLPHYISFDHDLGRELVYTEKYGKIPTGSMPAKSGYDFAKWLVEYMLDNELTEMFEYNVHSANPVGAQNITSLLDSFARTLK